MQADYVIIGAGSAGCAMAYRLAEAGKDVLVIEHGGSDAGPFIQMPAALSYPMNMICRCAAVLQKDGDVARRRAWRRR